MKKIGNEIVNKIKEISVQYKYETGEDIQYKDIPEIFKELFNKFYITSGQEPHDFVELIYNVVNNDNEKELSLIKTRLNNAYIALGIKDSVKDQLLFIFSIDKDGFRKDFTELVDEKYKDIYDSFFSNIYNLAEKGINDQLTDEEFDNYINNISLDKESREIIRDFIKEQINDFNALRIQMFCANAINDLCSEENNNNSYVPNKVENEQQPIQQEQNVVEQQPEQQQPEVGAQYTSVPISMNPQFNNVSPVQSASQDEMISKNLKLSLKRINTIINSKDLRPNQIQKANEVLNKLQDKLIEGGIYKNSLEYIQSMIISYSELIEQDLLAHRQEYNKAYNVIFNSAIEGKDINIIDYIGNDQYVYAILTQTDRQVAIPLIAICIAYAMAKDNESLIQITEDNIREFCKVSKYTERDKKVLYGTVLPKKLFSMKNKFSFVDLNEDDHLKIENEKAVIDIHDKKVFCIYPIFNNESK